MEIMPIMIMSRYVRTRLLIVVNDFFLNRTSYISPEFHKVNILIKKVSYKFYHI